MGPIQTGIFLSAAEAAQDDLALLAPGAEDNVPVQLTFPF